MNTITNTIKIHEVDCYIGNACATHYATDKAVQHQILVNDQPLGLLNKVADLDRGQRIVVEKEINETFVHLFDKCIELKQQMKSEYCNSMQEYDEAAKFNRPIKNELKEVVRQMWEIESLNLEFDTFYNILNY